MARLRAQQIGSIVRLSPVTMVANLLNAAVMTVMLWAPDVQAFLVIWDTVMGLLIVQGLRSYWHQRSTAAPKMRSHRSVRRAVLHAGILATLWGLLPLALFANADAGQRLMIATLTTGMLGGGAFALSTVPSAAYLYSGIMAACSILALASTGDPILLVVCVFLAIYAWFVSCGIAWRSHLFVSHFMDRVELERNNHLIGLLLRNFEENASDWLWEFDRDGRLQHISFRMAAELNRPAPLLQNTHFTEFVASYFADAENTRRLLDLVADRAPFRDLVVRVQVDGEAHWWSLTGKPVFDEADNYFGYRGVVSDITAAKRAEEKIAYMARFDALTGLPNRSRYLELLESALVNRVERGEVVAHLSIDLDDFKGINDTMGHATGDLLLKAVAGRLGALVGPRDMVTRLSADEFAIMQSPEDGLPGVEKLADRVVEALRAPFLLEGKHAQISASIGIAVAPRDGIEAERLIKGADLALNRAKHFGRNRYCLYEPTMEIVEQDRRAIAADLQHAVCRGEFELYYQPMIGLADNGVHGFEALLRWRHPIRGMVSPAEFIPIAEETGLIDQIGAWVVRKACEDAASWPKPARVAVNLSPLQCQNPNLLNIILSALGNSGLSPQRLELEITESVLIHNAVTTLELLMQLRALGVQISLDDFGTGYSSLSYLRNYPFDKIKIDRSFIEELTTSGYSLAIVEAVTKLAHDLGMATVAEGVETAEQLELLRAKGCTEVQGYLIGRPVPVAELEPFFKDPLAAASAMVTNRQG